MSIGPDISDVDISDVKAALEEVRHPIDVAVWSLDNYFNFGSIVRVSHNFLVRNIYAIDIPQYYRKADMGTRKFESITKLSLAEFQSQTAGRNLVAFERRSNLNTQDLRHFKWPDNPIAFFGSEKTGVPDEVIARANSVVSIPMFGLHNDHNVSIACGISLYDFVSKYRPSSSGQEENTGDATSL